MKIHAALQIGCLAAFAQMLGLANQVQISVSPFLQNVPVNSSFNVSVGIALLNIGEPPSLGTYDLDFTFDPMLLGLTAVVFGDPILGNQLDLFGLGNIQSYTLGSGTVNLFELSLDSSADLDAFQAGDFTMFVLTFSALSPGSSNLGVNINSLGDAIGSPISSTTMNGSVDVLANDTVPEPATFGMLTLGFAAVFIHRLRTSTISAKS